MQLTLLPLLIACGSEPPVSSDTVATPAEEPEPELETELEAVPIPRERTFLRGVMAGIPTPEAPVFALDFEVQRFRDDELLCSAQYRWDSVNDGTGLAKPCEECDIDRAMRASGDPSDCAHLFGPTFQSDDRFRYNAGVKIDEEAPFSDSLTLFIQRPPVAPNPRDPNDQGTHASWFEIRHAQVIRQDERQFYFQFEWRGGPPFNGEPPKLTLPSTRDPVEITTRTRMAHEGTLDPDSHTFVGAKYKSVEVDDPGESDLLPGDVLCYLEWRDGASTDEPPPMCEGCELVTAVDYPYQPVVWSRRPFYCEDIYGNSFHDTWRDDISFGLHTNDAGELRLAYFDKFDPYEPGEWVMDTPPSVEWDRTTGAFRTWYVTPPRQRDW